jgi:methionyl-tRNA formyltransferase
MMRIAVICNDRLGLPALQQLVQNRLVHAVATSDRLPEVIGIMKLATQQGGAPSSIFKKNNF